MTARGSMVESHAIGIFFHLIWYLKNYSSKYNVNILYFHRLQLSRQDYNLQRTRVSSLYSFGKIELRRNMHDIFSYSMEFSNECLYKNNNRADTENRV